MIVALKPSHVRFASTDPAVVGFGSPDMGFVKDRVKKTAGEENTKEFTYFLLGNARFIYASAARLALIKVVKFSDAFSFTYIKIFFV